MFIGTTFIPINAGSSNCYCSNIEIVSPALAIIGIILIILFGGFGAGYLLSNLLDEPYWRKSYRFLIYALCGLGLTAGILMLIYGNLPKSIKVIEPEVYEIYMEDMTKLEGLCDKFDIIDINDNIVTVREKVE